MTELFCAALVPLLIVTSIVQSMVGGARRAREGRHRWGLRRRAHGPRGDGAFRAAPLTETRERGTPTLVRVAGVLGCGLATTTGIVFAPARMLLGVLLLGVGAPDGWMGAVLVAMSLSGFGLSFGLDTGSIAMLRSEQGADRRARVAAGWSLAHHLALFDVFLYAACDRPAFALAAIPAGLGVLHALLLAAAAEQTGRLHAALDDEGRASLPAPLR